MIMYIYAKHNFVILSSDSPVKWFDDLVGVAYRYYDLRMNVVPLFNDFKEAQIFWRETIKWWNDHSIKIRFVETGNNYWFIILLIKLLSSGSSPDFTNLGVIVFKSGFR